MTDLPFPILIQMLLFLIFPLLGGYLAVKAKISPLIGYIVGGVVLKLFFANLFPADFVRNFSSLGLVLLIFTLGLETNFNRIKKFGRFVVLGGVAQIFISAFFILLLSLLFKFTFVEALFFGFAFSMSSTAVVSKIIQERGEEDSLLGAISIGLLVFQDLAFIPLLIIFSSFSNDISLVDLIKTVIFNTFKAGFVLFLVYYIGQRVVPFIFNRIASVSREILNIFVIVFIIASLALFSFLGLSSLLAAFIAGILLAHTTEHYHIFSQIRPLRDFLAVAFFVFLGLLIKPDFIITHFFSIILFVALISIIKTVVVLVTYLFFRFHSRMAFSLSLFLFEVGENAFILIYQGFLGGVIRVESYYYGLSVVLISLLLTPFVIEGRNKTYFMIRKIIKRHLKFLEKFIEYKLDRESPNVDALSLKNHIIICGYGRVGGYIGRALMMANIPFIAIDYNYSIVKKAKESGVNIIYGDPTEIDVLDYSECEKANVLISALPSEFSQKMVIMNAKKLNPEIIIFTRVHRKDENIRMKDIGADIIIQPEFEASLSIIRKIFFWKGMDRHNIAKKIKMLKLEHGMI